MLTSSSCAHSLGARVTSAVSAWIRQIPIEESIEDLLRTTGSTGHAAILSRDGRDEEERGCRETCER